MFNKVSNSNEVLEETIYIELKKLPSYSKLNSRVQKVVQESSWFERFGVDWLHLIGALIGYFVGHIWLGTDSLLNQISGTANALFCLLIMYNSLVENLFLCAAAILLICVVKNNFSAALRLF